MRNDSRRRSVTPGRWPALALTALGMALALPAAGQEADPWRKGGQWMSVRVGYAKSASEGAADGSYGGGFAYTRFLNSKWALTALAELNLLGRFGGAAEIESPWLLEISRHYRWPTVVRPFLGFGAGAYFHTFYRTGADAAGVRPGVHLSGGAHAPISGHSLLGFDLRLSVVDIDKSADPVFGPQSSSEQSDRAYHWSAKLDWAWSF